MDSRVQAIASIGLRITELAIYDLRQVDNSRRKVLSKIMNYPRGMYLALMQRPRDGRTA